MSRERCSPYIFPALPRHHLTLTKPLATFNLTDVQTGALSVRRYALSAKAFLDDGKAIRLELDDNIVEITPPGIEAVT